MYLHPHQQQLTILVTLCLSLKQVFTVPIVDPNIAQTLQTANETTVIITFLNSQYDKIIEPYGGGRSEKTNSSREATLTALYKELSEHAEQLHAATLQTIKGIQRPGGQKPYEFYSMWASTHLIVQNADKTIMQELSKSHEIEKIRQEEEFEVDIPTPEDEKQETQGMPRQGDNWGVKSMGCKRVWETGNRGKGVVIGFIDTGVNPDHDALKDNFRSHYGWFEPNIFSGRPYDSDGHGTAVASVAVGNKREVGCAPEAQWIACQYGLDRASSRIQGKFRAKETSFAKCFNFMSCPTYQDGNIPNCGLAPKVVSVSLGHKSSGYLDHYLTTLKKQNIVVIAGMGNEGPQCGKTFYPADSELTIGVGSITTDERVAGDSGRGPPVKNKSLIKPDVVAPGEKILVAAAGRSIKNSNSYRSASGTSYATPHVSGVAALYFHAFPTATVDQFRTHLTQSTRAVYPSGTDCGGIRQGAYPNFVAGHGSVDAFALMQLARGKMSTANQLFHSKLEFRMIIATGFVQLLQPFVFS